MNFDPFKLSLLLCSVVFAIPITVLAADANKRPEEISNQTASSHQAAGHRRGPKQIVLSNAEGAILTLWKPDLTTQPLEAHHGMFTIPKTGMDNYHAIVAEKDWGTSKETVIRYEYLRGKPSGRSTRELTSARKTDFEIVPQPVPREHRRYYSDETWSFLVRFGDQPVANVQVTIQTSNGTTTEVVSNDQGMVDIRIPDDFPNINKGERDLREAEFMLSTEHTVDDITYLTGLSASYRINQAHWKSLELGIVVIGLGMIVGGYIGRVRKDKGAK